MGREVVTMPKEIVIKEMINRYNFSEKNAETIYKSYEAKGEIEEIEYLLFYREGVFNVPIL